MSVVKKNVWQRTYLTLKQNGIDVYPPATKDGQCKKPYVVVKKGGSMQLQNYSTQRDFYDFLIYVPREQYDILSDYEAEVKKVLDSPPIYPMLMPTGQTENDYYDDNINAHLRIITYYNNVRVKHL